VSQDDALGKACGDDGRAAMSQAGAYVSLDELEELVEYAIASYHGTPHAGLNNVTPLEAMEHFIRGKQSAKRCSVRAPRHGDQATHQSTWRTLYQ